jgi:hypothetical protein
LKVEARDTEFVAHILTARKDLRRGTRGPILGDALGPGLKSLVGFESPSSSRTARPRIGCIARPKGQQIVRMLNGSKAKSTHKDSLSTPADKIGSEL